MCSLALIASASVLSSCGLPVDLLPLPAPDGQGRAGPLQGSSRAGASYDVNITAADGRNIAFTVHEPRRMVGGGKYPLLLHGPALGGARVDASLRDLSFPAGAPLQDTLSTHQYTDAGYGVISFDQRGFGQSGNEVSLMDPDKDGVSLIQIVDWAQVNLDWLLLRDDNLVLGAYGSSYGGGYQLLLNNIDPRRRLDAIAPSVTWNDLVYSLGSGDVPESAYASIFLAGAHGRFVPEASAALMNGAAGRRYSATDRAYLRFHSNRYFCDGLTQPGKRTATPPPRVDALFLQGMADTLFNFNEGKDNHDCLDAAGGDVRLFTFVTGHVLSGGAGVPPDGSEPTVDFYRCGPYAADALTRLWFDAKLKQDPAAVSALARAPEICINLGRSGEGVAVNAVTVGAGPDIAVPLTAVPRLVSTIVTVPLLTATTSTVVAGIPTATLTLADPAPASGAKRNDATVFVGIGLIRAAGPGQGSLQVLGDQFRPVHRFGTQRVQLNGIGVKLAAGDGLLLVLAGQVPALYPASTPPSNTPLPIVNVSGTVQLPALGDVATLD